MTRAAAVGVSDIPASADTLATVLVASVVEVLVRAGGREPWVDEDEQPTTAIATKRQTDSGGAR